MMVAKNANEATGNAKSYSKCDPGYCLRYVRTWLEIGSQQASAIDAWNAAKHKHKGDRRPKRGAPCFYRGGQYGHIVLAMSNADEPGRVRTTDSPNGGKVSTQDLSWCENAWGYEYLGWTEDLNGVHIGWLDMAEPDTPAAASGKVYVDKLHKGQEDSDSVARLRYRLNHHGKIPAKHNVPEGRNYFADTVDTVRWWQRNVCPADVNGPRDGTSMSNGQANKLFGDAYTVIEK